MADAAAGGSGATPRGTDPAGYGAAMAELEAILAEIEDDAVDVDVLTVKVARAADLIRWCRGRIDGARVDVERIVAELDSTATTRPPSDDDADTDEKATGP